MNWSIWDIITGPVMGAVIGYITNKIAVDMLFRPLNPVYIGKFHVPFTPGIIPKGKERFGIAVGEAVGNNLLPPSIIKSTLLSEDIKQEITRHLDLVLQSMASDDTALDIKVHSFISESKLMVIEEKVIQILTEKICNGLISINSGKIIANEVTAAVKDKIKGTMLDMFLQPPVIEVIEEEIQNRINQYIADNGEEKINSLIKEQYKNIMEQTKVSSIADKLDSMKINAMILELYQSIIDKHAEKLLSALNLSKIVEEKVKDMDTKEVEKLVLAIMKNELGAVVNLGALIGLILGLFNLIF